MQFSTVGVRWSQKFARGGKGGSMRSYSSHQIEINHLLNALGWRYWGPLTIMGRLIEEVGELAREINHTYGEKKKKSDEAPGDIEGEVGDILYTLVCFSNANGYLLDRAHWIASWKRSGYDGRSPLFILAELDRLKGIFVGEVAHWYGEDDRSQKISILSVEEALGNILRVLDCLAARTGFTLDGAIKKTVDKVTVRDKDRFPEGV